MSFIVPPCPEELAELYRDDQIVVVSKPSGLLSVPGRPPNDSDSALGRLQAINPESRVVHRLDMSTSGLMVFALNADSHRHLSRQFQDRKVKKGYAAEVWGKPEKPEGEVNLPLCCDWPNRPRQMVDHELGKPSLTKYQLMADDSAHGRVWLEPVTGRSHQLRVHMAELGHPIIGCEFYAHKEAREYSPRLHLHASFLEFTHPETNERITFNSPAPF
ncbi:RNA pseudouridine synthase [Endozoicomonas sp. OPT23]|uniref:pseudouridine synthase n=1 Tax=Endozoicomonas sp. OPT23 TaxID=2072845 RepID=UPI00129B2C27|nr:pseudouridine synthase [Endozoicomonas sp. OPT23]MRI32741.1 RNA pseudouridine synthase [Endozoicomonas sp. OPT23]